jgi:hypothetical protein
MQDIISDDTGVLIAVILALLTTEGYNILKLINFQWHLVCTEFFKIG